MKKQTKWTKVWLFLFYHLEWRFTSMDQRVSSNVFATFSSRVKSSLYFLREQRLRDTKCSRWKYSQYKMFAIQSVRDTNSNQYKLYYYINILIYWILYYNLYYYNIFIYFFSLLDFQDFYCRPENGSIQSLIEQNSSLINSDLIQSNLSSIQNLNSNFMIRASNCAPQNSILFLFLMLATVWLAISLYDFTKT